MSNLFTTTDMSTKATAAGQPTNAEKQVVAIIKWMLFGGIGFQLLINIGVFFFPGNSINHLQFSNLFTGSGAALLLSGACYGIGALVGFLFGIPRLLQGSAEEGGTGSGSISRLSQNDNLVQISDWLTKIIVGVGLTQISTLFPALYDFSKILSPSFGNGNATLGTNLAMGTILYFIVTGFFSGYLWTRIHFYRLLAQTSQEVDAIQAMEKQVVKAEEDLKTAEQQREEAERQMKEAEAIARQKEKDVKALVSTFVMDGDKENAHPDNMFTTADLVDDPHAGNFGGSDTVNGRQLRADISVSTFHAEMYSVQLEVIATDSARPLEGEVVFYLHPTFRNPKRSIPVKDGKAELDIIAWGSFTVGVECDNGQTKLELDLSKIPGVPQKFAER